MPPIPEREKRSCPSKTSLEDEYKIWESLETTANRSAESLFSVRCWQPELQQSASLEVSAAEGEPWAWHLESGQELEQESEPRQELEQESEPRQEQELEPAPPQVSAQPV